MTKETTLGLFLLSLALGCHGNATDDTGSSVTPGDDTGTAETGQPVEDEPDCAEAEARLGYPACVPRIADETTFEDVTLTASTVDQLRVGKYLVPAVDDARVPPVFLDVNNFQMHYDFLVTAFPDDFSGLTTDQYEDLTLYPDTREFYAGTYALYITEAGTWFGFTVWDDPADPTSTITEADVEQVWNTLSDRFEIGSLVWVPDSSAQKEAAQSWSDAPFPIDGVETNITYEVYNEGEAYGTLRLYTLSELDDATQDAEFGYQDILAIDEAPTDLERVVSGIVTGTRQGELSHLNVRSSTRGTPNCYIADPLTALADWEGQLVHFTCGENDWSIEAATAEQAEAWWDSIRPDPVEVCSPNTTTTDMPELHELATDTLEERQDNICTYGAKGSNLAALYQRIDDEYQLQGFLIPFHYYQEFMNTHTWTVDLGDGPAEYSFSDTLAAWSVDPTFTSDPSTRRADLEDLRDAIRGEKLDPDLLAMLAEHIRDVFGDEATMVRFRSSSNAEDSMEFAGAGLYESESGCLADELDDDDEGPSLCDPDKSDEQTLDHALLKVWASLWNMEAWDERDWYSIDQSQVAMGVLACTRVGDEEANAVAFSGNPSAADDDRYLINAQEGELAVVSSEPGVYPESVLLTLDDGAVTDILRVTGSSEVVGGEVLTDAELSELGGELWTITEVFPLDDVAPEGHDVLWDTEWKIDSTGQLKIKQIRPFLR